MLRKYVADLTALSGVSSAENEVSDYLYREFKRYCHTVRIDRIGNVIGHLKAVKEDASKLMIFAHMDEIGFIIRKIEADGYLRIERVGGVSTQILPASLIEIAGSKGKVKGIIGTPSHHFCKAEAKYSVPPVTELYVDIGAANKEEVLEKGVNVGSFATFAPHYWELNEDLVSAKALDDRAALAVILEFLRTAGNRPYNWDIYLIGAVMEEFNIRGIMPAVRAIKPDAMLGIDITPACDTPDLDYNDIALGKGPAITYLNFHGRGTLAGVLPDQKLLHYLENICLTQKLACQREVAPGVVTENAFALFENYGIAVVNLSIPTRYTHTPVECVSYSDLAGIVTILREFTAGLTAETVFGKSKGGEAER